MRFETLLYALLLFSTASGAEGAALRNPESATAPPVNHSRMAAAPRREERKAGCSGPLPPPATVVARCGARPLVPSVHWALCNPTPPSRRGFCRQPRAGLHQPCRRTAGRLRARAVSQHACAPARPAARRWSHRQFPAKPNCSNLIDVSDKLPLTVAATPDKAKVGAGYTALAAGCCRTCTHLAPSAACSPCKPPRRSGAWWPTCRPACRPSTAAPRWPRWGKLGRHLGWQPACLLELDAAQAQRAPSLPYRAVP